MPLWKTASLTSVLFIVCYVQVWDMLDKCYDILGFALPGEVSFADFERSVEASTDAESLVGVSCAWRHAYASL